MHANYERIVQLITNWGDKIVGKAGQTADIGIKKRWLTEFDLAIEHAVAAEIAQFQGKHTLFAEEEHTAEPTGDSVWILDPVSSTISFVRGIPLFSTVVSHVQNGVTVFAAVYDPCRKELFTAMRGRGAHLNQQRKLLVESNPTEPFVHFMPAHHSMTKEKCLAAYAALLDLGSVRMSGMSEGLAYAYVAAGRFTGAMGANIDVYPAWAGGLLVEEAGGFLTDFAGNNLEFKPHGVVCGAPELKQRLQRVCQPFFYS